jgi:hypothetical protein
MSSLHQNSEQHQQQQIHLQQQQQHAESRGGGDSAGVTGGHLHHGDRSLANDLAILKEELNEAQRTLDAICKQWMFVIQSGKLL